METRNVLFLDRDGVINVDVGYLSNPAQLQFIPGAIEAMKEAQTRGYDIIVVTNQSGVARGYYTEEDVQALHAEMSRRLLKNKKLSYSEGLVFESKYSYDDGYHLAERVIASKATAAFVTGDELAAGLLNGLSDQGIKVPEDFEIITSDDSQVARFTRPNLSTIGQPLYDIGAISMRMLTKIMHKEELEEREVLLAHSISERKSTRK